jgi:hypothetical protein
LSDRFFEDPQSIDFRTIIEEGVEKGDFLCVDELRRWDSKRGIPKGVRIPKGVISEWH